MAIGRLLILLSALSSALLPVFTRHLSQAGWDALQTTGGRSLVAVLLLLPFLSSSFRDVRGMGREVALNGAIFVIGTWLYVFAMNHINVGMATAITYLSPIWLVVYENIFGRPEQKGGWLACFLGFLGCMFMSIDLDWSKPSDLLGVSAALAVSFIASGAYVLGKRMTQTMRPLSVLFWGHAVTACVLAPILPSAVWNSSTVLWLGAFGLVSGVIYFWLWYDGMRRLTTTAEAGIIGNSEMIFASILAVSYFHQPFSWFSVVGAIFVIASGMLISRRDVS